MLSRGHEPDVVVVDGCQISFWLDPDRPQLTIDSMDRALMSWLRVFDRWADLFRAIDQPSHKYVGRPLIVANYRVGSVAKQVKASGAMRIVMGIDDPYEGLELHLLEYCLLRASLAEDVPTSWQLIRNADKAVESRDARLVCMEAGAAAETAISTLLYHQSEVDPDVLARLEKKTLGGKLHFYAEHDGSMPDDTELETHLRGLLDARNDATHGRTVSGERAEECLRLARLWAHEANPLPVYDGPPLNEEIAPPDAGTEMSGYDWHRLGRRLIGEGKSTAFLAMAEAVTGSHGDAILWVAEQAVRGPVEGADDALPLWLKGVVAQASLDIETVAYALHIRGFTRQAWSVGRATDWQRAAALGNFGARESLRTLRVWQRVAGRLLVGIRYEDPLNRTPSWGWHGPDIAEPTVPDEDNDPWLWDSSEWS
jgi:hypothetical protein